MYFPGIRISSFENHVSSCSTWYKMVRNYKSLSYLHEKLSLTQSHRYFKIQEPCSRPCTFSATESEIPLHPYHVASTFDLKCPWTGIKTVLACIFKMACAFTSAYHSENQSKIDLYHYGTLCHQQSATQQASFAILAILTLVQPRFTPKMAVACVISVSCGNLCPIFLLEGLNNDWNGLNLHI